MQTNTARKAAPKTHGGAPAFPKITPLVELYRSVLSCMLFEDQFYEDGQSIADRIASLCAQVPATHLAQLAIETRTEHNLRHVSLLLLTALAKHGAGSSLVSDTIEKTIRRADELNEFLALYWRNGQTPLSGQVKKGLAKAFRKFDAYQLAKYDREKAVRLRDVMFLVHPKPKDEAQAAIWKQLVDGTLPAPDTWETNLSAGADKKETFERLIREGNLGYLALLRNLRNMVDAKVDRDLIREALLARKGGAEKVLPFRFIAAARSCPSLEADIDQAFVANLASLPKLPGRTVVVVDTSGSMGAKLSINSDMTRMDAACALGAIMREVCEDPIIYATAGDDGRRIHATALVPSRRGMALIDATQRMQNKIGGGGIFLTQAMNFIHAQTGDVDRVIVITDEQDCSRGGSDAPIHAPTIGKTNYLINVASFKNGIGYGKWIHVDGFSESVIRWIYALEASGNLNYVP